MRKKIFSSLLTFIAAVTMLSFTCHVSAQETILFEENFDGFKAGTVDNYDNNVIDTIIDNYTTQPGWQSLGVHQAGGTCVLEQDNTNLYTYLTTPEIKHDGWVKVEMKVRLYPTNESSAESVTVYSKKSYTPISATVTKEWQTVSFEQKSEGSDAYNLAFFDYEKGGVLIQVDDVKVTTIAAPDISAPVAIDATELKSTGFTANWNEVSSADNYLLSVFEEVDGKKSFVFEDKDVGLGNSNSIQGRRSYTVDGLDAGKFYSYYVKAQSGNVISDPSNSVNVYNMVTPVSLPATDVTSDGFTANWEKTPKAERYNVTYYRYMMKWGRTKIGTLQVKDSDATSVKITGLSDMGATCFSYEVQAVSDISGSETLSGTSVRQFIVLNKQTEEVVLSEDFTKFTNGSQDDIYYKPIDPSDPKQVGTEYVNDPLNRMIPDSYTQTSGWTGFGVLEAGGVAAISYRPSEGDNRGGEIITPSMSTEGGLVKVSFRIKTIPQYASASDEKPQKVGFFPMVGNDTRDKVDIFEGNGDIILTDNDWHENTIIFFAKEGNFKCNFGMNYTYSCPFLIDDIKVSLLKDEPSGINDANEVKPSISIIEGGIKVKLESASTIFVYDIAGQLVKVVKATSGDNTISLPKGIYVIKTLIGSSKVII